MKNSPISIISGLFRGTKLVMPNEKATHPMGNREKNALFNIISPYLADAVVFDIYAGTGAIGLEALSRGAKHVVFVDKSKKCTTAITETLKKLNLLSSADVLTKEVEKLDFSQLKNPDVIILDPPYDHFYPEQFRELQDLLPSGSVLVLSHPAHAILDQIFPKLTLKSTHHYAACNISVFTI